MTNQDKYKAASSTQPEAAWHSISTAPYGVVVETKIDDGAGVRNIQTLKRGGNLWWYPDGSMYVYYTPTHWRRAASPTSERPAESCGLDHSMPQIYHPCCLVKGHQQNHLFLPIEVVLGENAGRREQPSWEQKTAAGDAETLGSPCSAPSLSNERPAESLEPEPNSCSCGWSPDCPPPSGSGWDKSKMTVDIDTLMTWARTHAPFHPADRDCTRRVRLEIAAVDPIITLSHGAPPGVALMNSEPVFIPQPIVARAYLAEPRCGGAGFFHPAIPDRYTIPCECGPLAEMRIG